jgi:hypothetical protein
VAVGAWLSESARTAPPDLGCALSGALVNRLKVRSMRRGGLDVLLVGQIQILDRLDAAREALPAGAKGLGEGPAKNHAATLREAGMSVRLSG